MEKKKFSAPALAAMLCLLLTLNALIPAVAVEYGVELDHSEKVYTQTFSDVPETHWAFKFVAEMVERGAISGYPDGKFYPGKIVTREEFAKIMVAAAGLTAAPVRASSYMDVPLNRWSSPFIETAKPYMTAYQSGGQLYFKPIEGALREDMAVAVVKLKGYDTRLADLSMIQTMFEDVGAISTGAQPYVALAVENGIISGYNDGTFRGQATITRAEAAAILWRAFQYGSDSKVMPEETPATPKSAATPKPVATPKPAATPKPVETMPPEPEQERKPFVAETLTKADISDTLHFITMDDENNLIYYDSGEKAILSLNAGSGELETLLDVNAAACTGADGVVYESLTVKQVFWDNVASRLLVNGTFHSATTEDGWETGNGDSPYSAFFTLKDGTLEKTFEMSELTLLSTLNDESYVCSNKYDEVRIVDLSAKAANVNKLAWSYDTVKVSATNNGIYMITKERELKSYDYSASKWIKKASVNLHEPDVIDFRNNFFYQWSKRQIRVIRPSDGATQTKLNPSEDVEVLDMRALPAEPTNLFVTTDEQYLFYDSASKVIRVIRANPDTN